MDVLKKLPKSPIILRDAAEKHYKRIGKSLIEAGVLKYTDLDVLCLYAEQLVVYAEAREQLDGQYVITNPNGVTSMNPLFKAMVTAEKQLHVYSVQLGLGAKSRVGVRLVTNENNDTKEDDDILKRKK